MFSITVHVPSLLLQVSVMTYCGFLALISGKPASHCFVRHAVSGKLLLIAPSWNMLFLDWQLLQVVSVMIVASCYILESHLLAL